MTVEEILERLDRPKRAGDQWAARCPAHEDRAPSLSIATGDDGRILLCCHAGCTPDEVVHALGLELRDLFLPREPDVEPGRQREVAAYSYVDELGEVLFQVVRFEPKTFRMRRPDGASGWSWSTQGVRRVLYRLPDVLAAIERGDPIYVVEGEKDADAIRARGSVATCNVGGAGKWSTDLSEVLARHRGRVVVVADRDEPGRRHARAVADGILAAARAAGAAGPTVELVEAAAGKDAADHLAAGLGLDCLRPLEPAEEPVDGQDAPAPASSWSPVDVVAAAADPPGPPVVLGLFYADRRHLVSGEPETGKGWLHAYAAVEEIRAGRCVVWVDLETSPAEMHERLTAFGLDDDAIRRGLVYLQPEEPIDVPAVRELVAARRPSLVVVDAMTGAMSLHGLDPNSGPDVERFYREVIGPLRASGAAVSVLDHVTKNRDTRGRFAVGSERKVGVNDVHLGLKVLTPFGRGRTGRFELVTHKDRPGHLARPRTGVLELRSDAATGAVTATFLPASTDAVGGWRPTVLMERISVWLERHGRAASINEVVRSVEGQEKTLRESLALLLAEGYLEEQPGPRRARMLTVARPYRELADRGEAA